MRTELHIGIHLSIKTIHIIHIGNCKILVSSLSAYILVLFNLSSVRKIIQLRFRYSKGHLNVTEFDTLVTRNEISCYVREGRPVSDHRPFSIGRLQLFCYNGCLQPIRSLGLGFTAIHSIWPPEPRLDLLELLSR